MKKRHALTITLLATAMLVSAARGGFPELPVNLGSAGDFVILAKAGISTVPNSAITGDMGVSPITATAITGFSLIMDGSGDFSTSAQVTGKIYAADYLHATPVKMTTAIGDMETAYTATAGRTAPDTIELLGGNISGLTIHPGLHKWSTGVLINSNVTLDAQGNPNAVFIFQIAGDLTVASAQSVILAGGAQAKNIFWQIAGGVGAVIGTTAHVEGIILTAKAITLQTGASFNGKLLAQTRVDLDHNNVMDSNLILPPLVRLEIISAHGTGTPPTGVYFNVSGSLLTNSITGTETLGGTQYVSRGWSMIGNGPESGFTNSMNMTHTNDAVLTWLWTTNYLLNASADSGGGVTGSSNGFYAAGSTTVVTATPSLGYLFTGWTGNVSGPTNAAVQTLTMDQARTVVAHFDGDAPALLTLTIISEHGVGTPPVGVYTNGYGATLTNSITGDETLGGTQYVNVGWSMIGNGPESGITNGMSMTQTNNAVLTWQWSTNYYLSLTALHGSITNDTPGWKPAGQAYELYPTPETGYAFDHWEVNGVSLGTGAPLTGSMDEAKNVIAFFRSTFIDVSSQVSWNVDWVCNPCKGYFIGTLTIANINAQKSITAPIWFEVQSTPQYRLQSPTGFDANTGMYYLDISTAVGNKLLTIGDGDLALDPGESVTITGIGLIGDYTPTGLVMAVWADPPDAAVASHVTGVAFEMSLPEAFAGAKKITVRGLPAGLKYSAATGMITGVPTRPGAFAVVISAAGVPTQTVMIGIGGLPTWAAGAFNGTVDGGGVASMTVSALGKVTGKLALGGKSYAFSAASYTAGGNAEQGFLIDAVVKTGSTLLPLTLQVTEIEAPAAPTLSVAVGLYNGTPVVLYHDVWKVAGAVLAPYVGYYTATLPGSEEHGSGYLTFTVDVSGKVKVAGKLADGTAASTGGTLILDEAGSVWAVVYTAPYAYKGGSLFGIAEFVLPAGEAVFLRPLEGGSFLWQSHNVQATSVYGEGFTRELKLSGGWFDKIGNLYDYYRNRELAIGTDADAPTPGLWAGNVAYESVGWDPDGLALAVTTNKSGMMTGIAAPQAGLPVKAGGVWDYDAENSVGLRIALTRATGVFNGSFKAWFDHAASHTSKNIAFTGVLTPEREDKADGVAGRGFFLWADKALLLNPQNKSIPYGFKWSYDLKILLSEPAP